jgi:hypothetical protein
MAGNVGQPPSHATATYALDGGLLREFVLVPAQGKMTSPYTLQIAITYDAKRHRFAQTGLGNDGEWWVSYAKPWSGTTESWIDHATANNKPGHSENVRESSNHFSFMSWDAPTGGKVNFKGSCTRST